MEIILKQIYTEPDRWGAYCTEYNVFKGGIKIGVATIQRRNMLPLNSQKYDYWLKYFPNGIFTQLFPKIQEITSSSQETLKPKLIEFIKTIIS